MLVWLGSYICDYLSNYILCLVVTFRPCFHSDYLAPSATALSKSPTTHAMFSLINALNCLPHLSAETSRGSRPLSWVVLSFRSAALRRPLSSYLTIQQTKTCAVASCPLVFTPWTTTITNLLSFMWLIIREVCVCVGGEGEGEGEGGGGVYLH